MEFELVSFKTCPYVQRSRITLLEKDIPHKVTYIELDDPPAWFVEASPLGKVPILIVRDGGKDEVLFESAAINEFLDEVTDDAGRLMPDDPMQRAQTRAWIEFGSECLHDYYLAATARDEASFQTQVDALSDKLARLDAQVVGPMFFGRRFTLVDAALAPLLMQLGHFAATAGFHLAAYPKLTAWLRELEKRPAVKDSIVPEWRELLNDFLSSRGGYVASRLA